ASDSARRAGAPAGGRGPPWRPSRRGGGGLPGRDWPPAPTRRQARCRPRSGRRPLAATWASVVSVPSARSVACPRPAAGPGGLAEPGAAAAAAGAGPGGAAAWVLVARAGAAPRPAPPPHPDTPPTITTTP